MVITRYFFEDVQVYWHAGWIALLLAAAFLTTKVRIAGDDVPDAPVVTLTENRPPSTYFRGSSGPPPKRDD